MGVDPITDPLTIGLGVVCLLGLLVMFVRCGFLGGLKMFALWVGLLFMAIYWLDDAQLVRLLEPVATARGWRTDLPHATAFIAQVPLVTGVVVALSWPLGRER